MGEGSPARAKLLIALALIVVATGGVAVVYGRASRATSRAVSRPPTSNPILTIDTQRADGAIISPLLFGLGVDLSTGTYVRGAQCAALAGAGQRGTAVSLVRIGASLADDYDWPSDRYAEPGRRPVNASAGCFSPPRGSAATVRRVLDRVRPLGAGAVVVLNGEIDDPQSAAGLARLVASRYGLAFARGIYWEIGNAPATWQHFAIPLFQRRPDDHRPCTPDQYAALVTSYAAAIGAALGRVPRIVADEWIAFATDQSWTSTVTAVDTQYFPFNSPDVVPDSAAEVAASVAGSAGIAANLHQRLVALHTNLQQFERGTALQLFVGSWNLDASSQPFSPFYGSSAQAVFVARLLMRLARDGVTLAAWAPPLYFSPQAPLANGQPAPGFRVFTALHALAAGRLVSVRQRGAAPWLDALAARLPGPGGRIAIVLTNASASHAGTVLLRLGGRGAAGRLRGTVRTRTFAPSNPDGVTAQAIIASSGVSLRIPALGVLILTEEVGSRS